MSIQIILKHILGETDMANVAPDATDATRSTVAETKQIVLEEIGAK